MWESWNKGSSRIYRRWGHQGDTPLRTSCPLLSTQEVGSHGPHQQALHSLVSDWAWPQAHCQGHGGWEEVRTHYEPFLFDARNRSYPSIARLKLLGGQEVGETLSKFQESNPGICIIQFYTFVKGHHLFPAWPRTDEANSMAMICTYSSDPSVLSWLLYLETDEQQK